MSNYVQQDNFVVFNPEEALDNLGGQDQLLSQLINNFLDNFNNNGKVDQIINLYKTTQWWMVGSEGHIELEREVHTLKGQCRTLSLDRLMHKLEKLQFAIRDIKPIQVFNLFDEAYEQFPFAQIALLNYLKKPTDNIRVFEPLTYFHDFDENLQLTHKKDYSFHVVNSEFSVLKMIPIEPYQLNIEEDTQDEVFCNIM